MIRPTDFFVEDFEYTKDDDMPLIVEPYLNGVAHNMTGSLIEIIITNDYNLRRRPIGASFDIGAYESGVSVIVKNGQVIVLNEQTLVQ